MTLKQITADCACGWTEEQTVRAAAHRAVVALDGHRLLHNWNLTWALHLRGEDSERTSGRTEPDKAGIKKSNSKS
jgi:hypothetical protein